MKKAILILILALATQIGWADETVIKPPMTYQWKIDDLVANDEVDEWQISPDGRWLAWTVSKWDLKEQSRYQQLFLTDLKTSAPDIQLTRGQEEISDLKWVPGKHAISFKTGRTFKDTKADNIWLMEFTGGESYPITNLEKGVEKYDWLDAENLIVIARSNDSWREQELSEKKDTSQVVEDEDNRVVTRFFRFNLKEKKPIRISDNRKPISDFFLSPNRQWLIYELSVSLLYEQDQKTRPRYFLLNLKNLQSREIFTDDALTPSGRFNWSLDNRGFYALMAFNSQSTRYTMAAVEKVYWHELANGREWEIDLDWDRYGGPLTVTADGFLMGLPEGVRYKYARFSRHGDRWQRRWINDHTQRHIFDVKLARDSRTMVVGFSSASQPAQYFLADLKGDQILKIREVMALQSPLFKRPLAKSEIITWQGSLNDTVEGLLYYPIGYQAGKKYPLIVMIHGGPNGADMDYFDDSWAYPVHLMAERGAFVLRPNYHGSSNYGIRFGESIAGHYYEYEVPDIEAGVDKLIAAGLVDPDKLGVIGHSNGAILGTALTIHSPRYRAASLVAGDVNWTSDYGLCSFGVAFDNYYFLGPPWEQVEHYVQKSPLFQMKKVTTPTLIFHGTTDRQVPYSQSWEYYRALQAIGQVPVRFISFPGEPHSPKKLAHQRRKLEEEIAWFEKHLFKTFQETNPALKKESPLARLGKELAVARQQGRYGILFNGQLIPETVPHAGQEIGRFEVTRAQWALFAKDFQYPQETENLPMTGIPFVRVQEYIAWLSRLTGETYRLPVEKEIKTLYSGTNGNTLDWWAGYKVNPDDQAKLQLEIQKLGTGPLLLRPVGSFSPEGDSLIYDLDGNAAEWVKMNDGGGKACGASADRPGDGQGDAQPSPLYTGFRVIKDTSPKKVLK